MGETVGVYQKNVYDKDGKILHRKGEKDYSEEAEAARKRYRETGGNVFGAVLTDETREVAERLDAADKARFQTKYDKTLSEYKEKAEEANGKFPDTEEGNKAKAEAQKKKSEFFNNQDSETQAKLMKFEAKMDNEREEKEAEKAERKSMASAALEAQKAIADASKSSAEAGSQSEIAS